MQLKRPWAVTCILALASGPATAEDWNGLMPFVAEWIVALPWCMLFLAINTAWILCRRPTWRNASVLGAFTALGPLGATWMYAHAAGHADAFATALVTNGFALAVALLPLAVMAARGTPSSATSAQRSFSPEPDLSRRPATAWTNRLLGWILLAAGAAIGCVVVRQGLAGYRQDPRGWETFGTLAVLAQFVAFAMPPAIVGAAFVLRAARR